MKQQLYTKGYIIQLLRACMTKTTVVIRRAGSGQVRKDLTGVFERAMPRVRGASGKKRVYWWTAEIGDCRTTSIMARWASSPSGQCHRRRPTRREESRLHSTLQGANEALKVVIGRTKDSAKEEFLTTLERGPMGEAIQSCAQQNVRRAPHGVIGNGVGGGAVVRTEEGSQAGRCAETSRPYCLEASRDPP